MSIVSTDCLVGHFRVSINKHEENDLKLFIERYEKKILIDLLGHDMYELLIADLDTQVPQQPQNAPWTDINKPFQICFCRKTYNCAGLKEMLTGFIKFHWLAEQELKKTASGTVRIDSENSTVLPSAKQGLANFWNDAVQEYKCIQQYICQNIEDFETETVEFKGITKNFIPLI